MSLATQIRDGSHRIVESPNKKINNLMIILTLISTLIIGIYTIINVFFISVLDYKYTSTSPLIISQKGFLENFDRDVTVKIDTNTPECLIVGSSNDMTTFAGDNAFEAITGVTPLLGFTTSSKPFVSSSKTFNPLSSSICSSDMWREEVSNNQELVANIEFDQFKNTSIGIYNPSQQEFTMHIIQSVQYDWTLPIVVIMILFTLLIVCWIIILVKNHHKTKAGIPFWERLSYKVGQFNKSDYSNLSDEVEKMVSRRGRRRY